MLCLKMTKNEFSPETFTNDGSSLDWKVALQQSTEHKFSPMIEWESSIVMNAGSVDVGFKEIATARDQLMTAFI